MCATSTAFERPSNFFFYHLPILQVKTRFLWLPIKKQDFQLGLYLNQNLQKI